MQTEKNGFVFYFDNLPILMSLPSEQRGWVIAALCRYAQEVWQNPDFPVEQAMGEFPALSGEGEVACRFMGAAVLRDTKRWLHQRDYRMQRRQHQLEASAPARKQVPGLSPDPNRQVYRETPEEYLKRLEWMAERAREG